MGSECWAGSKSWESWNEAEMRMVRWMCGVSLREKKTNAELRESVGIEKISDVMRHSRLKMDGACVEEGGEWLGEEEYGDDYRREQR